MNYITRILSDIQIRETYNYSVDMLCIGYKQLLDEDGERTKLMKKACQGLNHFLTGLSYEDRLEFMKYSKKRLNSEYRNWAEQSQSDIEMDAVECTTSIIESEYFSTMADQLIALAKEYNTTNEKIVFNSDKNPALLNEDFDKREMLAEQIKQIMTDCNNVSDKNILYYINLQEENAGKKMRSKNSSFSKDAHIISATRTLKNICSEMNKQKEEMCV